MKRYLESAGIRRRHRGRRRRGLARARELHPAAITLDVMMPDLDGWTVLAALKGDPTLADIPVVVVTIVDEKQRGYALGAAEYMVKPVDRDRLTAVLRLVDRPGRRSAPRRGRRGHARDRWRRRWRATAGRSPRPSTVGPALERLAERRADVIVLDLMMPEMDGFEFVAELRSRPGVARHPGAGRHGQGSLRGRSPPPATAESSASS